MLKNKILLSITGIIILLLITIGISYAYFTANLTGGEEATTITVSGGKMNITYNGGANINVTNIISSNTAIAIKTFTVMGNNTTDIEMKYKISIIVEKNTFSEEALKYKLISTNTDNNGTEAPSITALTNIGTGDKTIDLGIGGFTSPTGGDKLHTYNLEIHFPNTTYNQNEDQDKEFKGYIKITNVEPPKQLKYAILGQGGGASAIEAKGNPNFSKISPENAEFSKYYEAERYLIVPEGQDWFEGTDFAIGTDYTFNQDTGTFNLVNYTLDNTISSSHINYYACWSNQYLNCSYIFQIKAVSGSKVSTAIEKYSAEEYNVLDPGDTGLYAAEDDYGMSYYYRGSKDHLNNNLIFAGFQWKIIRINGDGSVRIIYNGTEEEFNTIGLVNKSGTKTQLNEIKAWNTTYSNDAKYVGYMYGGANGVASTSRNGLTSLSATYNETSINAKIGLDAWYQENISGKAFESKIGDKLFCNDRMLHNEVGGSLPGVGYGISETYYAARYRLVENKIPTLKCGQKNDRFTQNDEGLGNASLTYPVGLITADEAAMAGLIWGENYTNYLQTNQAYWTISPNDVNSSGEALMICIDGKGDLTGYLVGDNYGLRPVLNLSIGINVTGNGSSSNPYYVV